MERPRLGRCVTLVEGFRFGSQQPPFCGKLRLIAAPALVLPPDVVQPAAQPFDRPRDIADIIARHRFRRGGRRRGGAALPFRVGAIRSAIALMTQAEGVAEPEVGAAGLRIAPEGRNLLGEGRSSAEEAGHEDHSSHHFSMQRGTGPGEEAQRR